MQRKQKRTNPAKLGGKRVTASVASGRVVSGQAPHVGVSGPRRTTIRHREFIREIYRVSSDVTSDTFSLAVNPGIVSTFPWLSGVANQFELYQFVKLQFEYVPRCATSTSGAVSMALDLDALDPAPADRAQLMSYACSTTGSAWQEFTLTVPSSALTRFARERYTRKGVTTVSDVKTYDVGNLHLISSLSSAAGSTVGELFVSYEVILMEPQIRSESLQSGTVEQSSVSSTTPFSGGFQKTTGLFDSIFESVPEDPTILLVRRAFEGVLDIYSLLASGSASDLVWSFTPMSWFSDSSFTQKEDSYAAGLGMWQFLARVFPGDRIELKHTSAGVLEKFKVTALAAALASLIPLVSSGPRTVFSKNHPLQRGGEGESPERRDSPKDPSSPERKPLTNGGCSGWRPKS